ncbi:MAG: class I SAM-dependent methyltransferase [Jaaginema sp. PMC 1079.18]|nr:class I SAM-dependent methyltransferase [Jaaginema sp. PMC 1080.18]MEC4853757.1 class I SAM-dependent methyltransferase [Jaaginema sp. PMC 1079.18]MEC4866419.1 class I SAM-dependent methyltransferase [Jaaginema sp. PMC 1078.18]
MPDPTAQIYAKEREFHDRWAAIIDLDGIRVQDYFEACTAPENRFICQHLGDVRDRRLLDLGCGAGENSVYFALQGAKCVAADYSPKMVQTAQALAAKHNVVVEGYTVNAMALDFADNSFDIIYAANLLHHLPDPKIALREMHRVVKPGGKVCFWDPLIHNPIINIYRYIASSVRTEDEKPLSIAIVSDLEDLFNTVTWDTFWLTTLWLFLQFYFVEKVNPNQERYWKKIIQEHQRLRTPYQNLEQGDRVLKKIPGMKRWAWNLAVVATK